MNKSTHAQVASLIRTELKPLKLKNKPSIRSERFAGGNAVTVSIPDIDPNTVKKIKQICAKYKYGHFDSMTDVYEMDNVNRDIPQVKYLSVDIEYSDNILDAAVEFLKKEKRLPNPVYKTYKEIPYFEFEKDLVSRLVSGSYSGFDDDLVNKFWATIQ